MIYFLFGEDTFRSKEKLKDIIDGYKKVHKSGLNLVFINAKEKTFDDFYSNFKINSMFAEKKLIVVRNIFSSAKFQEGFLEKAKDINDLKDIVIVYEDEKVDQRTKIFKELLKLSKSQEFNFLQPQNIKKWALQKFEESSAKIDNEALDVLVNFVKNDLWRLSEEIKKLINYKKGGIIKREDIFLQVKPDIDNDIFKTIDAIAQRDKSLAISLLHKHIDNGDNVLYLLSMISYQFKNLIIIKDLIEKKVPYPLIAKKSGLHPFVVKKTYYLCNQFLLEELKKIYQKIFKTDADIKTGQIDPEVSLDLFISSI